MSMVAVFRLECCNKEIVHGRFRGDDMFKPSVSKCPFGCEQRRHPSGKIRPMVISFVRYESEDKCPEELLKTWRFPDITKIQKGTLQPPAKQRSKVK